jgi:hypothetical protein
MLPGQLFHLTPHRAALRPSVRLPLGRVTELSTHFNEALRGARIELSSIPQSSTLFSFQPLAAGAVVILYAISLNSLHIILHSHLIL